MSSIFNVEFDPGRVFQNGVVDLVERQLPYAAMRAVNALATQIYGEWRKDARQDFDRPVARTTTAPRYTRATKADMTARVFINDTNAGVPAAKYLQAEVHGGSRAATGLERGLQRVGLLQPGQIAVPAKTQKLNSFGNVSGGVVVQILSQLGALSEENAKQNETARSRQRNSRVRAIQSKRMFFAVGSNQRNRPMPPGIYQAVRDGQLEGVYMFVRGARYKKRYTIFDVAEKSLRDSMPAIFSREFANAIATAKPRGGA